MAQSLSAQQQVKQSVQILPKEQFKPSTTPQKVITTTTTTAQKSKPTFYSKLLVQTDMDAYVTVNGRERPKIFHQFEQINEIPVDRGVNNLVFTAVNDPTLVKKVSFNFDKRDFKKYVVKFSKDIQFKEIDMVFVEGGTFKMGSREGNGDEQPIHTVTVNSFYIAKFEITQSHWFTLMNIRHKSFNGCDDCPVEGVSWQDIQKFIKRINEATDRNYRLPTEAEWEYAAKGGKYSKHYLYAGSDTIENVGWFNENSEGKLQPVGKKKPNELGLYDMTGNVWEWCSDWYGENFYARSPKVNPVGPSFGTDKILRGGGFRDYIRRCRSTYRGYHLPNNRSSGDGFRLAISEN